MAGKGVGGGGGGGGVIIKTLKCYTLQYRPCNI